MLCSSVLPGPKEEFSLEYIQRKAARASRHFMNLMSLDCLA